MFPPNASTQGTPGGGLPGGSTTVSATAPTLPSNLIDSLNDILKQPGSSITITVNLQGPPAA